MQTALRYPDHDDTGSVGLPLNGYQVRVGETANVELSNGTRAGELLLKGFDPMTSYKGYPEATRECFNADGWMRTGDVGFIEGGKVYLVDRAKDIIKVNGWTVSPSELEAVLLQMPEVAEATALSSGRGTEEHAAIFVVAKEPTLSVANIMGFMMGRIARFKIATCEIHLVHSLPRNPAGKILRDELRSRLLHPDVEAEFDEKKSQHQHLRTPECDPPSTATVTLHPVKHGKHTESLLAPIIRGGLRLITWLFQRWYKRDHSWMLDRAAVPHVPPYISEKLTPLSETRS